MRAEVIVQRGLSLARFLATQLYSTLSCARNKLNEVAGPEFLFPVESVPWGTKEMHNVGSYITWSSDCTQSVGYSCIVCLAT